MEERQIAGLQKAVQDNKLTPEGYEDRMAENRVRNQGLQSFKINKSFGQIVVCFARVDEWTTLLNDPVDVDIYRNVYGHMNDLFITLFSEDLLPAGEFLARVFRIQFWFIHLMPFYRGSAAVMNYFRFIMTAYYNYRANGINRPMLPIAPPLMDYFPDLEALFRCQTEDDLVELSMSQIYCVNYNEYCTD